MIFKQRIVSIISIFLLPMISLNAQEDTIEKKKTVTIQAKTITIKQATPLDIDVSNGFKNAYKSTQSNNKKIAEENSLKNKGIISQAKLREERWNKNFKPINGRYKKVDQHLGDFRSNSEYIRIICRDYQYPDGDRVTIYINEVPVVYNIVLEKSYKEFKITLEKGINKIAFKALNQGTSGPNTAGFKVYDDTNNIISSNEWNLATGAVATLLIVKDN
jgi:hypothetical protein